MANISPNSSLRSNKRVSMRDVASRCGVSISTVSLVLSGDIRIPEDTTRKVLQTVKAMEYRPSILARNLARRGSRTIGVILPQSAFHRNQPFYYQALQGIHDQTQVAGYKMLVEAANRRFLDRRYYLRLLKEQSVDAILYMAASQTDAFLSDMQKETYPFILLGSRAEGVDLPFVGLDEIKGASLATRHLLGMGHTAIGFIGGGHESSSGVDRERGYRQAMERASVDVPPSWVAHVDYDGDRAEQAVAGLLSQKVTAIFVAGDAMAGGVLSGLRKLGRRVPDDMAVVGMDDLDFSSWTNPPLTTVRTHITELASQAARSVLDSLDNPLAAKTQIRKNLEPELVVRSSCGINR